MTMPLQSPAGHGAKTANCRPDIGVKVKEKKEPSGIFYYWNGERPLDPNAPRLHGTGEIRIESDERASGYFTTYSDSDPTLNARTVGVYLRAEPEDKNTMDGRDDQKRIALIAEQLQHWKSIKSA